MDPKKYTHLSPALRQYVQFKEKQPDYVLFFRIGDFYEVFFDDANTLNRVCGVALTSKSAGWGQEPIPMAGVPFHSVESYLRKMIAAGHKCAICEAVGREEVLRQQSNS